MYNNLHQLIINATIKVYGNIIFILKLYRLELVYGLVCISKVLI